MITSKKLLNHKIISHGFFNRNGGKSSGIYKSLNCGLGSSDNKKKVIENLRIVKNQINKKSNDIILNNQIHSNKFIFIDKKFRFRKNKAKADAIITDQSKLPIAVLTADCVPLLLFESNKNMIAAIHAGWRGAYKGIIDKVINFMIKKGCKKNLIIAAIGPCIGQNNYNVKKDFKKRFIKKDKKNKIFFKSKNKKYFFNLKQYIILEMKKLGIKKIKLINKDTFSGVNTYFSARRSLKKKENDYGRNLSLIMIN